MTTPADFRNTLERVTAGDTMRLEIARPSGRKSITVVLNGYDRIAVRILPDSQATEQQKRLRAHWLDEGKVTQSVSR